MVRQLLAAALALTCAFPALAASPDEPPYRWTCKAQGFFKMDVSPDGQVKPSADRSLTEPISIVIRKRSKESQWGVDRDMIYPFNDEYVVGFTGKQAGVFSEEPADSYETSGARFYFGKDGLYEVIAMYYDHYRPAILTISAADKDWVFSVYSGGLLTDKDARHMNITMPASPYGPSTASADVYFMTGPCVRS